mmetsp:Transcript_12173/g.32666  ORF Transcript_12173/g.32666 Transcript_12173/m.32666 type:complete len:209 (-) Transcript_12173:557-1183(-)
MPEGRAFVAASRASAAVAFSSSTWATPALRLSSMAVTALRESSRRLPAFCLARKASLMRLAASSWLFMSASASVLSSVIWRWRSGMRRSFSRISSRSCSAFCSCPSASLSSWRASSSWSSTLCSCSPPSAAMSSRRRVAVCTCWRALFICLPISLARRSNWLAAATISFEALWQARNSWRFSSTCASRAATCSRTSTPSLRLLASTVG